MSCKTAAQNSYDKAKVITACNRVLKGIKIKREECKETTYSGKKKYGFFGRELSVQEAYKRGGESARLNIDCLYAHQEISVSRILVAALFCLSDSIYLTKDELADIANFWEDPGPTVTVTDKEAEKELKD